MNQAQKLGINGSSKQLRFILPDNPYIQSQIHHANHKLHKTGGQKPDKGTCGCF